MSTYRTEDLDHGDVTTWLYDEATGLVTNKVYADGKGPTYYYTPEGRLSRRTWARGVTTDYAYDGQGRLVSKTYSDATPDVSLAYDRLGHTLSAICEGVSTNLYVYNRLGQLTNEVQNGTTIARSYDALGRATGYTIGDGIADGSAVSYAYDSVGRFAAVTSGTNVFAYSYRHGSDLVSGMSANTGHAWERIYEPDRDLIATVHNRYGDRTISRFDYTNDEIGRRITRFDSGEAFTENAFERYSYNEKSELEKAQRFSWTGFMEGTTQEPNQSFNYWYDQFGNRTKSIESVFGTSVEKRYESNELNQYTKASDGYSMTSLSYDLDGNMTTEESDFGSYTFTYDAENRVVAQRHGNELTEYKYDWNGRMIYIKTFENEQITKKTELNYNDNRIISEFFESGTSRSRTSYGWDVSDSISSTPFFLSIDGILCNIFCDGQRNVRDVISGLGVVCAHYEFTPFGEIEHSSGHLKDAVHIRFSSELVSGSRQFPTYKFRQYSPEYGRWISRDLDESLSKNLYRFVKNDPISRFDHLGLVDGDLVYGEIGECILRRVTDEDGRNHHEPNPNLADAKASLVSVASRNSRIARRPRPNDGGLGDQAWDAADEASGGTDISNGAKYYCINVEPPCGNQRTCARCKCRTGDSGPSWYREDVPLTITNQHSISVGSCTIYLYDFDDSNVIRGWCSQADRQNSFRHTECTNNR